MALEADEKLKVVRLLGWPGLVLTPTSQSYNSTVNTRISNLPEEVEDEVRVLLLRIEGLDEKREAALCRASTKKIDDIELNENELTILGNERKKLIGELSDLLEIMIYPNSSQANRGMVGVCV